MKSLVIFGLLVATAYGSIKCPINHDEQLAENFSRAFHLAELPFSKEHVQVHMIKTRFLSLRLAARNGGFARVAKLLDMKDRLLLFPTTDPLGPGLYSYIDLLVEIRHVLAAHASEVDLIYLDESITVLRAIQHGYRHHKATQILDFVMKQFNRTVTGEQVMVKFALAFVAGYKAGEEVKFNPTNMFTKLTDAVMQIPMTPAYRDNYNMVAISVQSMYIVFKMKGARNETVEPILDLVSLFPMIL